MANAGRVAVFNPNVGISDRGQIGAEVDFIDPYVGSTTQEFPIGTRLEIGTRVWRYALMGAVVGVAGKIYQSQVIEANGDVTDAAVNTATAGDLSVEVTNGGNTAIAADEYKDGYVLVQDDTGEGYALQIEGNDAIATSAAGTIFLYDKVQVTFAAATTVALTHPVGYKVVVSTSPITGVMGGVAMGAIAAASYCWLQTKGPAAVFNDSGTAIIQGSPVRTSEDHDGFIALEDGADNFDQPHVGLALHVTADNEVALIDLQIE
jgi:hypothetical protein